MYINTFSEGMALFIIVGVILVVETVTRLSNAVVV